MNATAERQTLTDDVIRDLATIRQGVALHAMYPRQRSDNVVQLLYSVHGALDRRLLSSRWERVLQLHTALSERFFHDRGAIFGERDVDTGPHLEWKDWRWLPSRERAVQLMAFLSEDRKRGFNLAGPSLIRLAVVVLSEETCLLLLSLHPQLLEGGSGRLLLMEGLRSLIEKARAADALVSGSDLAEAG